MLRSFISSLSFSFTLTALLFHSFLHSPLAATFQKSTFIWRSQIFWLSTLTSSSCSSFFLFFFFASRQNCYELSIERHIETHTHTHTCIGICLYCLAWSAAAQRLIRGGFMHSQKHSHTQHIQLHLHSNTHTYSGTDALSSQTKFLYDITSWYVIQCAKNPLYMCIFGTYTYLNIHVCVCVWLVYADMPWYHIKIATIKVLLFTFPMR